MAARHRLPILRTWRPLPLTPSRIPPVADAISLRDRVRVPDGRVGKVIGFYRRDEVSVCVLFDGGDSGQFLNALLSPLG